jgi:hypothetical protein
MRCAKISGAGNVCGMISYTVGTEWSLCSLTDTRCRYSNVGLRDGRLDMRREIVPPAVVPPSRVDGAARLNECSLPVFSYSMTLVSFRSCKIHALNTGLHLLRYSIARSMHRKVAIDTSPPSARWMKDTLVRSAFHRSIPVVAARLPAAKTGPMLKSEAMRG